MTRITLARSAVITGAILLSCTMLLAACGGASNGPTAVGAPRAAVRGALAPGATGSGQFGAAANGTAASGSAPNGAFAPGNAAAQQTAKLAQLSQSIIFTADLTVRPKDAMTTAKTAIRLATMAGGYVSGENAVSGKSGGMVTLTLKVPVPNYQALLTALSGLGKQVALTQHATDVTQEVADVNSLVSSQEAAITALQHLLSRAATVSELLQVQQQISSDESNLEALQSQQRALSHETTYATISMTLLPPQHHRVQHKHHKAQRGFLAGLSAGWRAFTHAIVVLLTALGAVLPFLIVVAILAGAGLLVWRRGRTNRPRPTSP